MKATVLELKDGFAALLQEDGIVVKMKNKNFMIGDVVDLRKTTVQKKGRWVAMVVAAAMFVMLIGGGIFTYATPTYYVSLDVNPGVLMEVNIFERVIGMEAANEDAEAVLAELDLQNKDIEEAISMAIERITELGYFDEGDGNILIAATSKDEEKAERLVGKLQSAAKAEIAKNDAKVEVTAGTIGYDMVQAAKAIEGMTPGKYNLIVNLLGKDANEYSEMSVEDIMKEFTATKGAEGKARAAEAGENDQNEEENGEPAENSELKEQNAVGKPETPKVPETPGKPETPVTPEAPEIPEKPETPVTPEIPETPVTPEIPEAPEIPEKPETPVTPETPEIPEVPVDGRP